MTAPTTTRTRRGRPRGTQVQVFRYVPGGSVVHRVWAGTKLLAVVAFSVGLSLNPSWAAEGILLAALLATLLLARVPRSVVPRLPRWIWILLGIGSAIALLSGGPPVVHIGNVGIGLGGIDQMYRFIALSALLLLAAATITWTTELGDLAPAVATLLRPLRLLRLPVDEFAVALGLSIRCLPLLMEELRTLYAARRVRRPEWSLAERRRRPLSWLARELIDLLVCALVSAIRRAREMGEAMEARGGPHGAPPATQRPGWRDAAALLMIATVTALLITV